jgi:rhomboid family GlyGly-CTERM serine protease
LTVAGLAGAGTLAGWWLPAAWLDWQPALAFSQPWRWLTAAFVHWSPLHLGANLAGLVVVAALGWQAGLPRRAAGAWALAWPLTHAALLLQPALAHYGGLSGVLHAGVAVAGLGLLRHPARRGRRIGAAVLVGLAAKIALERPWAGPLSHPAGWDIAVAPMAHVGGALAGLICGVWLLGLKPNAR